MKRRVAITGVGCTTSLGSDVGIFWENLLQKKSGISKIEKFDASQYTCQIAGEIKEFDPSFCIPGKDIKRLDPFSLYGLTAAYRAIEDAKLEVNEELAPRVAVIVGSGMGGVNEVEEGEIVIRERGPRRITPFFVPKVMINAIAGEISLRHGFQGQSYVIASACATGSQAIATAMRTIQYGDADVVISGGTEAIITPLTVAGFCSSRAMTKRNDEPERASRPFDRDRDGFVMGEGAGILVLEEWEHAKKRGVPIYAELAGAGCTSDAYHITSPHPEAKHNSRAIRMALEDARVDAEDVGYVNAHGTSTKPNDATETLALKKVFGDYAYKIPVSSTKSMLGHLLGASGAIEAVVTTLSIQKGVVHPTANYENPDPDCDLDYVPGDAREVEVKSAISNSFGFGGHNVSLVLKKAVL